MSAYTIPAADAPAEEWGRLAKLIPDFRWMCGAIAVGCGRVLHVYTDGSCFIARHKILPDEMDLYPPDPDDPATAGCLLALLGVGYAVATSKDEWVSIGSWPTLIGEGPSVGRACIAAAAALGRWPGGSQ